MIGWVEMVDDDCGITSSTSHYPEDGCSVIWFTKGNAVTSANIMHTPDAGAIRAAVHAAIDKGLRRLSHRRAA